MGIVSPRIEQRPDLIFKRYIPAFISSYKTLVTFLWIAAIVSVFVWQKFSIDESGTLSFRSTTMLIRPLPKLRPVVFNLIDFGGVGDGVTLNTVAFEKAVAEIEKIGLKGSGGAQLNVPPGKWLTAPFNLTSFMTLFLAEGAVILAVQVSFILFYFVVFLSY